MQSLVSAQAQLLLGKSGAFQHCHPLGKEMSLPVCKRAFGVIE